MALNNNAQYTYQATRISTATKEQLLLITYDIGIKACHAAENAMNSKNGSTPDFALANREILRTQDVIRELMVTLNTEKAGEMGKNLMSLYEYMHQLLVDANIKKEPDNVILVREMLEELKATWAEALVKLLQDYQASHPDDKDFQNAISELKGDKLETKSNNSAQIPQNKNQDRVLKTAPIVKNVKAGSFTLAG